MNIIKHSTSCNRADTNTSGLDGPLPKRDSHLSRYVGESALRCSEHRPYSNYPIGYSGQFMDWEIGIVYYE